MSEPPVSPLVRSAAAYLEERYAPHIAALLAYGSRVAGQARAGSACDFWLIVKDPTAFHRDNAEFYRTGLNVPSTAEVQIALNRTGPLFYSLQGPGCEIKIAVVGEAEFVELCRSEWWTVKGRMQKPVVAFRSTRAVEAAILGARREGLAAALNLVPRRFRLDDLLEEITRLSYRAEIRPELKRAKVRSILESAHERLEDIYRPLIEELPYVARREDGLLEDLRGEEERRRARRATLAALRRSKWSRASRRFIWRNFCSHGSPVRYILLKLLGEVTKSLRRLYARLRRTADDDNDRGARNAEC